MAKIEFNNGTFKLIGEGHVEIPKELMTPEFLVALIRETPDSTFFLPDFIDIMSKATIDDLRDAFKTVADPFTFKRYQEYLGQFASMQVGRAWTLHDLVPVWRTKLELHLINEIIRVKDGRAFVILTGSNELISEHDLYRRTLKTISEHLDAWAMDAHTVARYTKATLQSPIVQRKICASTPQGIVTMPAWGPECLEVAQWELPAGVTFISLEA